MALPQDEAEAESMGALAAMDNLDLTQLSDPAKLPGLLQSLYTQQMGASRQAEQSAKDRFEKGQARIAERNQGPSQSEQLFMLSKALLAPRKYRGFAGTIGKISGALGDISDVESKARQQREAQLAALQDSYAKEVAGFGVDRAKTAADLVKTAAPLLKPPTIRSALNSRDEVVNLNTAEIINPPPPPVGTIKVFEGRKYTFIGGDQYDKNNWKVGK